MPRPEPIGEPAGITAAQPTSASRRARIGSSLVYGSTRNPSATSVSAARSSSTPSGSRVRSSPITSSLTRSVSNASRARWAVFTASRGRVTAGGVRQHPHAEPVEHRQQARPGGVDPAQRHGDQFGPGRDDRRLERGQAVRSAGAEDQPGLVRRASSSSLRRGEHLDPVAVAQPDAPAQVDRGTTAPLTATATPRRAAVPLGDQGRDRQRCPPSTAFRPFTVILMRTSPARTSRAADRRPRSAPARRSARR